MKRKFEKTRRALWVALALATTLVVPLRAQSPTPEGTVIKNKATVSWTDANNNTYASVSDSVNVTVGFAAGIDVTGVATVTPASPSTGNVLSFPIQNIGNGTDTVSVAETKGTGITVTGYRIGGSPVVYVTVPLLNAALAVNGVAAGASLTVEVLYNVAAGQGGQTIDYTLTATSKRDPTKSDPQTTQIKPPLVGGVAVTPDNSAISRLPSNGTNYTETFTVTNNGNSSNTFSLLGSKAPGTALTIVSVNGVAGTSGGNITLAAGAAQNIAVVYSVGNVAAATVDTLKLTATSTSNGSVTDPGSYVVTVVKAAVAISKQAFRDDRTTQINSTTDRVLPGEFIQYKVTVTNNGASPASSVSVTDALPAQVTYNAATGDAAGWTFTTTGSTTVQADLTGSLASAASRFFWIRVQVK